MNDKDVDEITSILFPKANKLILTQPDNSRALLAGHLKSYVPDDFPPANVFTTTSVLEAVEKAQKVSAKRDLILVTGSLYLVGDVKRILTVLNFEK